MELGQNIKLIIFDFDGTLFDLEVDWGALREQLGISGTEKSLGALMQEYRAEQHADLRHITNAELNAVKNKRLSEIVQDVLENLSRNYVLAILTRNSRFAVEEVLKGTSLENSIYIVGREDVAQLKPDPEGIAVILDHFHCKASDAILVGDTSHDVEAARIGGITGVVVSNQKLAFKPEGADVYIDSLSDLL